MCGKQIPIIDTNTGNAMAHFKRETIAGCEAHGEASRNINARNPKMVTVNGESCPVFTFEDNFPHHVDFVYMVADGLPKHLKERESFKKYVQGYAPHATHPHNVTIGRIAACIEELQDEDHASDLCVDMKKATEAKTQCYSLQLDLCTDTNSTLRHVYASLNMSRCVEVKKEFKRVLSLLDCSKFPSSDKTADNITDWLINKLTKLQLPADLCSTVTPDGDKTGLKAIWQIEDLDTNVIICHLHQLQRSVLYATGGAGVVNAEGEGNIELHSHLVKHKRVVQLTNQSNSVSDAIIKCQKKVGVTDHKLMATVNTHAIRWGNIYKQVGRNNILKDALVTAIEKHKKKVDGDEVAIVLEQPNKTVETVQLKNIGLSENDWMTSLEVEAFLEYPYDLKETLERSTTITIGQSLQLMKDLKETLQGDLDIKNFPRNLKEKNRKKRKVHTLEAEDVGAEVTRARNIMEDQLENRFFNECPPEPVLVQLRMSKQQPIAAVIEQESYRNKADAAYKARLKQATVTLKLGTRSSPRKKTAVAKASELKGKSKRPLFRAEGAGRSMGRSPSEPGQQLDHVAAEIVAWDEMDDSEWTQYVVNGVLDEFAFMSALNKDDRFPLHCHVWQGVAHGLSHEGNSEETFSGLKRVSHPSSLHENVSTFTKIAANKHRYQPTWERVKKRYMLKYGKGSTEVTEYESSDSDACNGTDSDGSESDSD